MKEDMKELEKQVYDNLKKMNNEENIVYDIYVDIKLFPRLVELGCNYNERLAILKMCYLVNCSIRDLKDMTLKELILYMKETNEFYEEDKEYLNLCVELIRGV